VLALASSDLALSPVLLLAPELAEVAFATGTSGHCDLWVVQGDYDFDVRTLA
jgi:hypothetical protein